MRDCDPEVEDETKPLLPCAASDQSGFPQQQQGQAREHTLRITEKTPLQCQDLMTKTKTRQVKSQLLKKWLFTKTVAYLIFLSLFIWLIAQDLL